MLKSRHRNGGITENRKKETDLVCQFCVVVLDKSLVEKGEKDHAAEIQ
jgi:hypothetical protein